MKTIIAGGREITDHRKIFRAIAMARDAGWEISEVVSGCCRGVDTIAAEAAGRKGVHVEPFPANWDKHGKAAGIIRNRQMAEYADALIAIWNGKSRGTRNMIEQAGKMGLRVFVVVEPTQ